MIKILHAIMYCFFVLTIHAIPVNSYAENLPKKFIILTASYNNIDYYKWNLDSVFNQTYDNWELVYIDDMSTDGTTLAVPHYIQEKGFSDKVHFVSNTEKCYCLKNYYREIHKIPDDSIIITLDGDDAFIDNTVLEYLNDIYQDSSIWCTFGDYEMVGAGAPLYKEPLTDFPQEIVENNNFRNYRWNVHHLRSFYARLFKNIKVEDFYYEGDFIKVVEDVAFMLPILEQCGFHQKYISRPLYLYNIGNPLLSNNVWKAELKRNIERFIYSKPKYQPLTTPPYKTK